MASHKHELHIGYVKHNQTLYMGLRYCVWCNQAEVGPGLFKDTPDGATILERNEVTIIPAGISRFCRGIVSADNITPE
jgi:hypothetical protein